MSRTTLFDVPEEIFHVIFQSLSQPDLHALCLTCKTLCYFSEPALYSHINWIWLTSQTPPIAVLLRTILSRPQLATYIQDLVLEGKFFDYVNFRRAPQISVAKSDLERPLSWVESLEVPYRDLWIRELKAGTMDVFCGRPHSTAIASEKSKHRSQLRPEKSNSRYTDSFPQGERLENGRYRFLKNTDEVLPIFYLPALQHLSISIDNPVSFAWPAKHPPGLSALVSLDVTYLREDHLRQILSHTKGLKMLKWSWFYEEMAAFDDDGRSITETIDLDKIVEALLPVRETLVDLTITADLHGLDGDRPPAINGSLQAMVKFNKLTKFEVPQVMLNGSFTPPMVKPFAQILPKNMESLIITEKLKLGDGPEVEDADLVKPLRAWLSSWKVATPNLQSISVLIWATDTGWFPEIRKELKEICDEAGISFVITTLTADQWHYR